MGGEGSGTRYRYNKNPTTSDYRQIDIRRVAKASGLGSAQQVLGTWHWDDGSFVSYRYERETIELQYSGNGEQIRYLVSLEKTNCHFGGSRYWFRCPDNRCGRRVAILYGAKYFVCRKCLHLGYASQREDVSDRAVRKANQIRSRLGWRSGFLSPNGPKPKGMHWKTYFELALNHEHCLKRACGVFAQKFAPHMVTEIEKIEDPRDLVDL